MENRSWICTEMQSQIEIQNGSETIETKLNSTEVEMWNGEMKVEFGWKDKGEYEQQDRNWKGLELKDNGIW